MTAWFHISINCNVTLHYSNLHVDCLYHHGNSCNSNAKFTISEYVMDITQHSPCNIQMPNNIQTFLKGKENGKTIMRASISYTLYY